MRQEDGALLTAGGTAVKVDAAGNLVARGADTFTFDAANRLTSATVAGASEAYAYDGEGVRVGRQVGVDPPISYVSDVNANLPVTLDDGTRKHVYGLGLAYAVSGSGLEVYHTDRLGTVRALTDGSGTVTATYRTDEWGVPVASTGGSTQPFGPIRVATTPSTRSPTSASSPTISSRSTSGRRRSRATI